MSLFQLLPRKDLVYTKSYTFIHPFLCSILSYVLTYFFLLTPHHFLLLLPFLKSHLTIIRAILYI